MPQLLEPTVDADPHSIMRHVKPVGIMADAVRQTAIVALQSISKYRLGDLKSVSQRTTSCGAGCQSGCTHGNASGAHFPVNVSPQQPRTHGRCGSAFNNATCEAGRDYGGCCSSGGYCGPTID